MSLVETFLLILSTGIADLVNVGRGLVRALCAKLYFDALIQATLAPFLLLLDTRASAHSPRVNLSDGPTKPL